MLTTVVGVACFVSGGILGTTIMAILIVAKVSGTLEQQENNN